MSEGASGLNATPLRALVDWALDRVHRHLQRHGLRLTTGGGRLSDLFVGVEEVRRTFAGERSYDLIEQLGLAPPGPVVASPRETLAPLRALGERLGLDALELDLLAAATAPHLSLDLARLYAFAVADFTARMPPAGFLCELVTDDAEAAMAAHRALRADGRLVGGGLLRLTHDPQWNTPPATHQGVVVPPAVLAFLRGEPCLRTEAIGDAIELAAAPDPVTDDPDAPAARARIEALLDGEAPRAVLVGEPGTGRRRALAAACARRDQTLLTVALDRLPSPPELFATALGEALLEARMRGHVVLLLGDDLLASADDPRLPALARAIRRAGGPLFVAARQGVGELRRRGAALDEVTLPVPGPALQRAQWVRSLTARGVDDHALADTLTARFSLAPGHIEQAVEAGSRAARLAGEPLGPEHIAAAARSRIHHALDAIAEPLTTTLTWDDVVLPEPVVETLREIVSQARNRALVFDTWGFRRTMAYGRGLACLFTGPPGTGKTMMAGIVAAEVGRALYRVDLSRVVSKWVGETEKNLSRIFDEAERAQVILFFDEADSLFSTRTEVKGANDRFANMEVNYLLQRMESYDGMTILTTNFERGLDPAFKRRLRFQVHFPLPDAEQRAEMWLRMIPAQMPVEGEVDAARLGKRFKLSGGNIKNAVLRAAFYAAEAGGALTERMLARAAEAETREMGRL